MGQVKTVSVDQDRVIEAVETSFNFEDAIKYDCGNRVLFIFDDTDGLMEIEVRLSTKEFCEGLQGIHLSSGFDSEFDLSARLADALSSCFRDGFDKIWIHVPAMKAA